MLLFERDLAGTDDERLLMLLRRSCKKYLAFNILLLLVHSFSSGCEPNGIFILRLDHVESH